VSRVVTRADRSRDLIAMVVLVAGAALYAYAWYGMHNLATKHLDIPKGVPAMRYFDTYWQMFRLAKVLFIAGAAALAWSFWSYSRRGDTPA
jgi:hypothetical protein